MEEEEHDIDDDDYLFMEYKMTFKMSVYTVVRIINCQIPTAQLQKLSGLSLKHTCKHNHHAIITPRKVDDFPSCFSVLNLFFSLLLP